MELNGNTQNDQRYSLADDTPSVRDLEVKFYDYLTGLYNHSAIHLIIDQQITRCSRHGCGFSLALIDIDDFTLFNEKHSYIDGDQVLRAIGELIVAQIRDIDVAARYTEDKFVVLLADTDPVKSVKVAERIQKAIMNSPGHGLTASIGLVSYPSIADNRMALIEEAKKALQTAKLRGRNSIYCLEGEQPPESIIARPTILVVDDDPINLKLMEALFVYHGNSVICAGDGQTALHIIDRHNVDLLLVDVMMPGIDGYQVCKSIKSHDVLRMTPVVLLTALDDSDSRIKGIMVGADDFITKPARNSELIARVNSLIRLKKINKTLTDAKYVMVTLANAIEARDPYTQGHVERVANYATALGRKLGLDAEEVESLWFAGILHDIGKIGVPDHVLNKPGPLNQDEWELMRRHPAIGYEICIPMKRVLGSALVGIRHHHEKLDGTGYPDGLKGDAIPRIAKIMAVADCYDALVTTRPYRRAMTTDEAMTIISRESARGKFDSDIARQFIDLVKDTQTHPEP